MTRPLAGLARIGPLQLARPTRAEVTRRVLEARSDAYTYEPVGGTRDAMPEGWNHDRQSLVLGRGDRAWDAAVRGLQTWSHFDLGWVTPHDRSVPLEPEETFAFVSWQLGLWSVNICRIVYTVDAQASDRQRFGFAYGTVGSHVVRGEELFLLERDHTGTVRFEIRKFSLPSHPLVRLAGPVGRAIQRRFSTEALVRLQREVTG